MMFRVLLVLLCFSASEAFAATNLKSVDASNGERIQLVFDQKVDLQDIRTEFFRDIVQISLKNTAVYPAKIINVEDSLVKKVFAYQYTPNLVRLRLTVGGNAEDFRDRFHLKQSGKILKISLNEQTKAISENDRIKTTSSSPIKKTLTKTDEALLQKVEEKAISFPKLGKSEKKIRKATSLNFLKAFGWLFAIVCMILGVFLSFRFLRKTNKGGRLLSALNKVTSGKIPGMSGMIEVVSTKHLGPKKSIAVVRIQDRTLLVGIADDSINLIADLSDSDLSMGQPGASGNFENLFATEKTKPAEPNSDPVRVRDRIRQRVGGMKAL